MIRSETEVYSVSNFDYNQALIDTMYFGYSYKSVTKKTDKYGKLYTLEYYDWKGKDGYYHRLNGPARMWVYPDTNFATCEYFIDGMQFTPDEFKLKVFETEVNKHLESMQALDCDWNLSKL